MNVLYKLFNKEGELIYAGISKVWAMRLSNHKKHQPFRDQIDISKTQMTEYDTYKELMEAEKELIKKEKPRYNKIHNPNWFKIAIKNIISAIIPKSEVIPDPKPIVLTEKKYLYATIEELVHFYRTYAPEEKFYEYIRQPCKKHKDMMRYRCNDCKRIREEISIEDFFEGWRFSHVRVLFGDIITEKTKYTMCSVLSDKNDREGTLCISLTFNKESSDEDKYDAGRQNTQEVSRQDGQRVLQEAREAGAMDDRERDR